jgi:hypothetical protein
MGKEEVEVLFLSAPHNPSTTPAPSFVMTLAISGSAIVFASGVVISRVRRLSWDDHLRLRLRVGDDEWWRQSQAPGDCEK